MKYCCLLILAFIYIDINAQDLKNEIGLNLFGVQNLLKVKSYEYYESSYSYTPNIVLYGIGYNTKDFDNIYLSNRAEITSKVWRHPMFYYKRNFAKRLYIKSNLGYNKQYIYNTIPFEYDIIGYSSYNEYYYKLNRKITQIQSRLSLSFNWLNKNNLNVYTGVNMGLDYNIISTKDSFAFCGCFNSGVTERNIRYSNPEINSCGISNEIQYRIYKNYFLGIESLVNYNYLKTTLVNNIYLSRKF